MIEVHTVDLRLKIIFRNGGATNTWSLHLGISSFPANFRIIHRALKIVIEVLGLVSEIHPKAIPTYRTLKTISQSKFGHR